MLGVAECLLQVPKTGSSFLKSSLGLPTNVNLSSLHVSQRHPESKCTKVLVPIRDPVERFLSGIGTIYKRSCSSGAEGSGKLQAAHHCRGPLTTIHSLAKFARAVLDIISRAMNHCSDVGAMGYNQLTHVIPQVAFAALVASPDARMYGITAGATAQLPQQQQPGVCQPLMLGKVNAGEGVGEVPVLRGLNTSGIPPSLMNDIASVYAVDYAWLGISLPK